MISYYRSGRQAEALQVFRDVRGVLQKELGLEPGLELRELEQAILVADPVLDLTGSFSARSLTPVSFNSPVVPRQLPIAISDFTGRKHQLARLRRRLTHGIDEVDPGGLAPAIEVVFGKGGIGKTTLAVHLAQELSEEYRDGQLFARLQDGALQAVDPGQVLETFLLALGVNGKEIPAGVDARAAMYRDRIAERRLLLLLDDAVDEAQVLPLLPGTASCSVVITSRARLPGLPGVRHTTLDEFDEEQGAEFVGRVLSHAPGEVDTTQLKTLVRLCGGLPLALRIASARLAAHPHWAVSRLTMRLSDETRTLDELAQGSLSVRDSIALSCQHLTARANALFRRLALVEAPDFGSWVAAPLAGVSLPDAEDLLEALVDAHLVEVETRPGAAPRYRLHHLVRLYAQEQMDRVESTSQHEAILHRFFGACLFLAEAANAREYGSSPTMPAGSSERWLFDAHEIDSILGDPLNWLECELPTLRSIVLRACRAQEDELAWSLALPMITLFELRGAFGEWQHLHETVLETVTAAGNTRGRAAMLYSLGAMHMHKDDIQLADPLLEQAQGAFDEVRDQLGSALALRNRAYIAHIRGEDDAAMASYERVLVLLTRAGVKGSQAHVLSSMARIRINQGDLDRAEELLGQAQGLAQSAGSRRISAQISHRTGQLHLSRGSAGAAAVSFRDALSKARCVSDQIGEAFALYGLGLVQLSEEHHTDAQETLHHAVTLATQSMQHFLTAKIRVALAEVERADGNHLRAARDLAAALPAFVGTNATPWQIDVLRTFCALQPKEAEFEMFMVLAERLLADVPDSAGPDVAEHAQALRRRLRDNCRVRAERRPTSPPEC
jgi:tetratricopeptide (TPR) repeat protein